MALIKCPECGKEISDKANACPNCGCPMNKTEEPTKKTVSLKLNKKAIIIIISVVIVLTVGVVVFLNSSKPKEEVVMPFELKADMSIEGITQIMKDNGYIIDTSSTSSYYVVCHGIDFLGVATEGANVQWVSPDVLGCLHFYSEDKISKIRSILQNKYGKPKYISSDQYTSSDLMLWGNASTSLCFTEYERDGGKACSVGYWTQDVESFYKSLFQ